MGTTADKLNLLLNTKAAIREAIAAKGQAVADTDPFSSYPGKIAAIETGTVLPELTNPGAAGDLLSGKQLIDANGNVLTGTMPSKSASDLTASGATVTVPAGHYAEQASKSVAAATQATPSISVNSSGLITASATQTAGYVATGTKSATRQLTTQAAKTVTPGRTAQTAVAAGRYTTGAVTVAGDANLLAGNIKSGVNIFGVAGNFQASTSEVLYLTPTISGTNIVFSYEGYWPRCCFAMIVSEYNAGLGLETSYVLYGLANISVPEPYYSQCLSQSGRIRSTTLSINASGTVTTVTIDNSDGNIRSTSTCLPIFFNY